MEILPQAGLLEMFAAVSPLSVIVSPILMPLVPLLVLIRLFN
ncbi:MAG: hypothetical protein ACI9U2_004991 [Bradymonadia bacterium]|jgi:hypothetical protein